MADIFFSYSRSDREFAARLYRELQRFKVRGFMDQTDLAAGADFTRQVREAIKNADAMLVILSRQSAKSSLVLAEVGVAQALGKPVIPVLAPGERYDDAVPPQLVDRLVIDAGSTSVEEVAAKVVAGATGTSVDSALSEVQSQALRRQRRLLFSVAVLLVMAITSTATAYFALVQRNQAVEARAHTEAARAQAEAALAQAEAARARVEAVTGSSAALSISPEGGTMAAGTAEGNVIIWDLALNRQVATIRVEEGAAISGLAYSPNGGTLAVGDWRGRLQLWDVRSLRQVRAFQGHTDAVIGIQFLPDGTKLYSRSLDGSVREWSVATGQQLGMIPLPK